MLKYLNKLEENRKLLFNRTEHLTEQQYNLIPAGYGNNIIWNMGHLLVVSENILYKNSPDQKPIHTFTSVEYQRGGKPQDIVNNVQIFKIRNSIIDTAPFYKNATGIGALQYAGGSDQNGGVSIISEERMQFLLFPEEMHYRTIARLMQLVEQKV